MQLQVLAEVIHHLETCHIDYMLSGSMAMCLYAAPRFTRDFDIVVAIKDTDIDQLAALWGDQYYYSLPSIREDIKRSKMFNIIHLETMHKVDMIVRTNHPFEIQKFRRKQLVDFMDIKMWVITPEDLILSKLNWIQVLESDIQKRDILNLLDIETLDRAYIRHWISQLKLKTYNLNF
jgi:hypothetical protein